MNKRILIYSILLGMSVLVFAVTKIQNGYYYVNKDLTPPQLARLAVEKYITGNKIVRLKGELKEVEVPKAGVFVSIYKKTRESRQLRGCIGSYLPTEPNLAQEIVTSAIAATMDSRFEKISENELDKMVYSVDILSEPQKIKTTAELNPKKYGIIISSVQGSKSAMLLPDLSGIDTVDEQIAITLRKAGINPDKEVNIQRFTVQRYRSEGSL